MLWSSVQFIIYDIVRIFSTIDLPLINHVWSLFMMESNIVLIYLQLCQRLFCTLYQKGLNSASFFLFFFFKKNCLYLFSLGMHVIIPCFWATEKSPVKKP